MALCPGIIFQAPGWDVGCRHANHKSLLLLFCPSSLSSSSSATRSLSSTAAASRGRQWTTHASIPLHGRLPACVTSGAGRCSGVEWSGGVTDLPSKRHHTPKPSCVAHAQVLELGFFLKKKQEQNWSIHGTGDGLSGQSSPREQRKHGSGRVLNFEQDS